MRTSQLSFAAPWSTSLKLLSLGTTLLLLVIAVLVPPTLPTTDLHGMARVLIVAVCVVPLVACALFTVRGYRLEARQLLIERLLWSTAVPLDSLSRAWPSPHAMDASIRLFGNGGLYAFTGLFSNKRLGRYRAFVTDPGRSVVLQFPGRTIVISPGSPGDFIRQLRSFHPRAEYPPAGGGSA